VFLINVPIGAVAGIASLRMVPATAAVRGQGSGRKLDLPGALLVVASLGIGVLALAGTDTHGWGSASRRDCCHGPARACWLPPAWRSWRAAACGWRA